MKTKYAGIRSNSYAEKVIDFVMKTRAVMGPQLAAHIGITTYEMGVLRRALDLGYLQVAKHHSYRTRNVYSLGEKLNVDECGLPTNVLQPVEPEMKSVPVTAVIVPGRTASVFKPLNLSRIGVHSMRDGAMEYKDIPSFHARFRCV